jgi:hypothetical protein
MKPLLVVGACTLLSATLFAQTPQKGAAKTAETAGQGTLSPEDQNIRAYIELLRTDLRKSKSQVMGEVLRLDTDESQKFWPIYKEFETEMLKVGDQIVALLKSYADSYENLSDASADRLANQLLNIERERNALKKKYYDRMNNSLGGFTAMRFLQVENQLERLVDLQLAAQLPVASR